MEKILGLQTMDGSIQSLRISGSIRPVCAESGLGYTRRVPAPSFALDIGMGKPRKERHSPRSHKFFDQMTIYLSNFLIVDILLCWTAYEPSTSPMARKSHDAETKKTPFHFINERLGLINISYIGDAEHNVEYCGK